MAGLLNGPAKQYSLNVGAGAVTEVKKAGDPPQPERQSVILQSEEGSFRVFWGDGNSVPSVATVQADGVLQWQWTKESYEAADTQPLFVVSDLGTIKIHIVERA